MTGARHRTRLKGALRLGDVDEADAHLVRGVLAPRPRSRGGPPPVWQGLVRARVVVLAADRQLVAVAEANRHREPVVALPVELPVADREQHLALVRSSYENDAATLPEPVHVQEHRADHEAVLQVKIRAEQAQHRARVTAPGMRHALPGRNAKRLGRDQPAEVDDRSVDPALLDFTVRLARDDGAIGTRRGRLEVVVDLDDEPRARLDERPGSLREVAPGGSGRPARE